jgi:phosphodiesterase/alkaline phosphatase D-like protein
MCDRTILKTAQRCAIVTPHQEHESGTFNQYRQRLALYRARICRKMAAFAPI